MIGAGLDADFLRKALASCVEQDPRSADANNMMGVLRFLV
jgi:hypothetical protein